MIAEGNVSIKIFMTYDLIKVDDESLLDLLLTARKGQALVCVHAENHGMISWMGKKLVAAHGLPAGHVLTAADVAIKSPNDGLPPYELPSVLGRALRRQLAEDDTILFEDLV